MTDHRSKAAGVREEVAWSSKKGRREEGQLVLRTTRNQTGGGGKVPSRICETMKTQKEQPSTGKPWSDVEMIIVSYFIKRCEGHSLAPLPPMSTYTEHIHRYQLEQCSPLPRLQTIEQRARKQRIKSIGTEHQSHKFMHGQFHQGQ